jgi:hypothetical protein
MSSSAAALTASANSSYCIGRNTDSIPGDKEADAMFTSDFRERFVAPKKV